MSRLLESYAAGRWYAASAEGDPLLDAATGDEVARISSAGLDLGAMATIWRGGCIIRARFLNRISDAYAGGDEVVNLLTVQYFADAMAEA